MERDHYNYLDAKFVKYLRDFCANALCAIYVQLCNTRFAFPPTLPQLNRVRKILYYKYLQTSLKLRIYTAANCETVEERESFAIRWQLINWLIAVTNVNSYARY